MNPKVSIIICAKDEALTIGNIIKELSTKDFEIIVIDGHSKDNTREIISSFNVKYVLDDGKGKGSAIRFGIDIACGEIIVFMDADGSHKHSDISRLIDPILKNEADMVIGSRMLGGSDELHGDLINFIRNSGSCFLAVLINYRWGTNLTDIENGFRAIKKSVAQKLGLKRNSFVIEQEMVMKLLKKGYIIKEISSHEFKRQGGVSKLPTLHGWKFIVHFIWEMLT